MLGALAQGQAGSSLSRSLRLLSRSSAHCRMERDPYRQPQVITHSGLIPAADAAVIEFSGMLIRIKHLPGIGSEDLHCLDPKRSFATVLWMKQLFIAVLVAITATLAPAIWPDK